MSNSDQIRGTTDAYIAELKAAIVMRDRAVASYRKRLTTAKHEISDLKFKLIFSKAKKR